MGRRIYTDAQREEAMRPFKASSLGQEETLRFVSSETGMAINTVRSLAAGRGLTKLTKAQAVMPADEQEWIRKVREEVEPPPTPTTTCERCPMTRNAGGGHMMSLLS